MVARQQTHPVERSLAEAFGRAESLGLAPRPQTGGFTCRCPAHDDRDPSLSVRAGDRRLLLYCFTGCDPADVTAALGLEPGHVALRSAGVGASGGRQTHPHRPPAPTIDYGHRDAVYRLLWSRLPVTGRVADELARRGLGRDALERQMLGRELPQDLKERRSIAGLVLEAFGPAAASVPGLVVERGVPGLAAADLPFMVVPAFDDARRLVGFQLRAMCPCDGGKYRWLSKAGGPPLGPIAHCPPGFSTEAATIRATEGVLKAAVATELDPANPCVGLPGWSSPAGLPALVRRMPNLRSVDLCPDADAATNPGVREGTRKIGEAVAAARPDVEVAVLSWGAEWAADPSCKGIDDLLARRKGGAL